MNDRVLKSSPPQILTIFRSAISWWVAELRACVPERIRRFCHDDDPQFLVELSSSSVSIHQRGKHNSLIACFGRDELVPAALTTALGKGGSVRPNAQVGLPPERILQRTIRLPRLAARTLRQVIGHEIARQTPFQATDAAFDCHTRVMERDSVIVDLSVMDQQELNEALEYVRWLGFRPVEAGLFATSNQRRNVDFLRGQAQTSVGWKPIVNWGLALATGVLILAAVLLDSRQQQRYLVNIRSDVAAARTEARTVENMQAEILERQTQQAFLRDKRNESPAIALLDKMTAVLPDNSWVYDVALNGSEGRIQGFSLSASALLAAIEQAPEFSNARFASPLIQGPEPNSERFNITFAISRNRQAQ
jgi:general secretion pathway protein L